MKANEILTDTDLVILQHLYVDRLRVEDVCRMHMVDRRYVGELIRRPTVQAFIKDVEVSYSADYAQMESEAINVLRTGMSSDKESIKQQAADKVLKVLGRYKEPPTIHIEANEVRYVSKVSSDGVISSRPASTVPPSDGEPVDG